MGKVGWYNIWLFAFAIKKVDLGDEPGFVKKSFVSHGIQLEPKNILTWTKGKILIYCNKL